jgi:hypothetical protein
MHSESASSWLCGGNGKKHDPYSIHISTALFVLLAGGAHKTRTGLRVRNFTNENIIMKLIKMSVLSFSLLALGASTAHALQYPEDGGWWNPSQSGRGYLIERQGNVMFIASFHYAANGRPNPDSGPPGAGRGRPPQAMIDACVDKAAGDACSAVGPQGRNVQGTCFAPPKAQGAPLACRPTDGRRGGDQGTDQGRPPPEAGSPPDGNPPQAQQGGALSASLAFTATVLCGFKSDARNVGLNMLSRFAWQCANGQRTLVANGVPSHSVGVFPNAHNPNKIAAQKVSFSTTLQPLMRAGAGQPVRVAGFALNGVKFDPGTGGSCPSEITSTSTCTMDRGPGQWRMEALGQTTFNFGVDANNAHVQPDGSYHYHGLPVGLLNPAARAGTKMQLIGWARDGYPMYAHYGYSNANSAASSLRKMRGSYRVKTSPDATRPPTALVPMGTFMQDYEYVAGLGDLDECNGRFGVTPEFPKGVYHYYVTETYPYIQHCVKGTPAAEREGAPGAPP